MAEVDIDVGTRRRLPLWMLGITASDQLRKAENEDENEPSLALGDASQAPQPKKNRIAKRPDKEMILPDKDSLVVDSSLLVKCAAEERKRKSGRREVDRDGRIYSEGDLQKKRAKRTDGIEKTIQKPARQKKKKGKSYRVPSMGAIGAPSLTEEDGELTMEDLMSIAEEYVQADEEMDHQQSKAESKSKTQLPTTIISADELDCSLEATHTSGRSSTHTTMGRPTSDLTETRLKAQDDLASEGIVVNLNRTGDPTQDMLDLFLGPLLKKPQSDERKLELTMEDMTLAYEFREQSQNKVVGEEVVPLLKKKSSLKDKVAMFLD